MLLDEFPALGKLGIFEQAIAYFGGWNIKAYLICQDKAQLDAAYGKDESITSNCHITVAYAPNKVETAKYLSDRLGVTTVIKEQESISFQGGTGIFAKKSVTKSQQEVQRAVLTPDEIMRLPGPVKDVNQNITEPGDMLIFSAGFRFYISSIRFFQNAQRLTRPREAMSFMKKRRDLVMIFKIVYRSEKECLNGFTRTNFTKD